MDTTTILHFLSEFAYLLITFGIFLGIAIFRGRQNLINLICGLYLALLITIQFPYYDILLDNISHSSVVAAVKLIFFGIITFLSNLLFRRIMPDEYREGKFESFGKKIMLALGATVLVMIFSFNILPVTEFLTPGTPIQTLFGAEQFYFWWLMLPLVFLYIN